MWSKACDQAFAWLKICLASTEVLAHYNVSLPAKLDCDASAYGVGAVPPSGCWASLAEIHQANYVQTWMVLLQQPQSREAVILAPHTRHKQSTVPKPVALDWCSYVASLIQDTVSSIAPTICFHAFSEMIDTEAPVSSSICSG